MFKLENENVLYKAEEMIHWINYGRLYVAEKIEETIFDTYKSTVYQISKFNFESGGYEISVGAPTYNFGGKEYNVDANGCFSVDEEILGAVIESSTEQDLINAEILLNQAMQDTRLTAIDEALAVILLNLTGGDLSV